ERRQAGKKEYVIGCTQLEQILEQALGLSESIPVTPATIISDLREMREECRKRKQGELLFPPILVGYDHCTHCFTSSRCQRGRRQRSLQKDPKTLRHIQGIPQTPPRQTKPAHGRKHYASL
ncbi:uncharacterized protein VP01_13530g2, partial [Puccinia sorghi]